MDSMRRNAQKMMPHVMALNKKPTMGMKNDRQPAPAVSKLVAYAKGGKVMAKGGAADKKQDKSMLARHNKLMHPGQKSKLMNGGMVKKYADGGSVDSSNKPEMRERLKQAEIDSKKIMRDAQVKYDYYNAGQGNKYEEIQKDSKRTPEMRERLKQAEIDSKKIMRDAQDRINNPMNGGMVKKYADGGKTNPLALKFEKERDEPVKSLRDDDYSYNEKTVKRIYGKHYDKMNEIDRKNADTMSRSNKKFSDQEIRGMAPNGPKKLKPEDGYKKGGKVKAKGDKKKVMGTVGEAKSIMAALKKARRPATPMPGTPMAGLGMAPPMKHGGKVRKYADGSKAEAKGFLDKPRDFITDDRYPNKKLSIRDVGKGVKEGFTNYKDMINRTGKFESPSKDGKVMKKAAGGAAKLRKKSPMPNKIKMMLYGKGG